MKKKTALIFGINGQDGSYLAKKLIEKKYSVFGITRKKKSNNLKKLRILKRVKLFNFSKFCDVKIKKILRKNFTEIYFLAGQSSVKASFDKRLLTYESQVSPLKNVLDFIVHQKGVKTKFLYAGSSEIFGNFNYEKKINEKSPKKPLSPYGMSKLIGYEIIKSYRSIYKIPVCTAILFNHESPLRSKDFVFKKIIDSTKKIEKDNKLKLKVGNINIKRDWGWGPEYMEGCYKILNSKKIDDYIIATEKTVSLKQIINFSFNKVNLNWKNHIIIDKKKFRKFEISQNYSNTTKLRKNIKWFPKYKYKDVIYKLFNKKL